MVEVTGLFGYMDHVIRVRPDSPTILTAPNGAGKTHILMLVRAGLSLDVKSLASLPFSKLTLTMSDKISISISRHISVESGTELSIVLKRGRVKLEGPVTVVEADLEAEEAGLPSHIRQFPDGRLYDARSDRYVSKEIVERKYGSKVFAPLSSKFGKYPVLRRFSDDLNPIFIDTKRLDVAFAAENSAAFYGARNDRSRIGLGSGSDSINRVSPISQYIDRIRTQVSEARRNSIRATQSADVNFAQRAIDAANDTVRISDLKMQDRYSYIVKKYEELSSNGLAVGDQPIEFPQKSSATIRRILNIFLDDWEQRLTPLFPLNEKLRVLRSILDTKLEGSGKKTSMGPQGDLRFIAMRTGKPVKVSSLSSGEQHLVALFTLLLFGTKQGSIVMIDEPEISMHAAWKHAFLDDIELVSEVVDIQVLIATHSTSIINGRWSLAEELNFSPDRAPLNLDSQEDEEADLVD